MVEFGLTEAAADDGDGTVVGGTVKVSPEVKELSLTGHVLSEGFKTRPNWNKRYTITRDASMNQLFME